MKKKGFTLIELLAVIIILAVIALITVPIVLNIIEKVRIGAAESSAKGYTKAVEYQITNEGLFDNVSFDGEYDVIENELGVVYQGIGPSEGYFIIENNMVSYGELCINGYPIKYENGIGKYSPEDVTCIGGIPPFEEPEGPVASDICLNKVNYDDTTNIKIKTVEDLACISNLSTNGKTFEGKTVMLLSDIDINDSNSYNNSDDTFYGDINGNGEIEGLLIELTTEKGFKPIANFYGTFEGYAFTISNLMINRSSDNNVGLFSYISNGIIRGFNLRNVTITGKGAVGCVVGYLKSGTLSEITITGTVTGSENGIGGLVGSSDASGIKITSILVKDITVTGNSYIGGIVGWKRYDPAITGVIEKGSIKGSSSVGTVTGLSHTGTVYISTLVTKSGSSGSDGTTYTYYEDDMLSGYDIALDTWIGGDNDSSGYYYDYDENKEIVIKSVEKNPITFTLKGSGTEDDPYLIKNYEDWKEATTKIIGGNYFKLTNDIDFKDKSYYAMGTNSNPFNGTINGDFKTISNIVINGTQYSGLIGYNNGGTIKGVNIKNANISGTKEVGGVVGNLSNGTVNEVTITGNITGSQNGVGGIVGSSGNTGIKIKSILVKDIVVTGPSYVGGIVGWRASNPEVSGVIEKATIKGSSSVGTVSGLSYTGGVYTSNLVSVSGSSGSNGTTYTYYEDDMLSGYDALLDTWIGGDNDSSGYYYDYDENNEIIIKSVEKNPITFNLAGSGTSEAPYLIGSYQDWKEATVKTDNVYYFKLINNIDFKNKKYYALGTGGNPFKGVLDGDFKTISNIVINGTSYSGLVGINNGGTIKGLNIDTITIASGSNTMGSIVGHNSSGTIVGINVKNANISGTKEVGGIVGNLSSGTINEVTITGNVTGSENGVGGIVGSSGNTGIKITNVLANNITVTGPSYVGGIVGWRASNPEVTGVIETATIKGSSSVGTVSGLSYTGRVYTSTLVSVNGSSGYNGTNYSSEDINDLGYYSTLLYNSNPIIESSSTGDINGTGYYFDYGNDGYIKVVPVGGIPDSEPTPGTTYEIDSNYTATGIVGTTDTTAPTCELYYVKAVSNGIRASFSCTDENGAPSVKSLFDSTTSKSAATFDGIGTSKTGSVSGNTRTVVSTWNTSNTVSQPTPGTCYYFRYGAQDTEGNWSTYVTNVCYTGFSE